jgi:uncharacterized membrane protein YvbJ
MGQNACDKCGELVDEAKAFCPACGHAFVEEEQRQEASAFEQMDSTVHMGKTMYGQMLSDMGLNISKSPDKTEAGPQPEKRVEVIAPIVTGTSGTPTTQKEQTATPPKKNHLLWLIIGAIALILLLALLVVVIAVVIMLLNR